MGEAGQQVPSALVGGPLGVLIGVVSGLSYILLLWTAFQDKRDATTAIKLSAELLAIPTSWFGGPWATGVFLSELDLNQILGAYVLALAATFVLIAGWPTIKVIIRVADRILVPEVTRG